MNNRQPLSKGQIITLQNDHARHNFRILKAIGTGASCIVYEAFRLSHGDVSVRCRIKECYPAAVSVTRSEAGLEWSSENERKKAFQSMHEAHDIMIDLRNNEIIGNNVTGAELYYGYGTMYSVMEINYGKTYDAISHTNLREVIATFRVLSNVVGKLHEQGYLHLDIKPENFLVNHSPSTYVWLFDVDSFIPVHSLLCGDVNAISCTPRYAAPEILSGGRRDLIGPAADIYSIGATLFETIMGRTPCAEDRSSFPEWEFSNPIFNEINPLVSHRLAEILQKSLARNVADRYDSAQKFSDDLAELQEFIQKPYLLSNHPRCTQNFVGRESNLEMINDAFNAGKHICVISGMGGIGKSELAKKYAELWKDKYSTIVFSPYDGSVLATLNAILVQNFTGSQQEKYDILHQLLDKKTLWIIDSFDSIENVDLHLLEELRCDILITSRSAWDECNQMRTFAVTYLPHEKQIELFKKEYGRPLSQQEMKDVKIILQHIEGYTLMIPLIAKQAKHGYCDIHDIVVGLRTIGIKRTSFSTVKHLKDGTVLSGSVYDILLKIFDTSHFAEAEIEILHTITLTRKVRIKASLLADWFGKNCITHVDRLIESGWICREKLGKHQYLGMHMVLAEILYGVLNPTISSCKALRQYIQNIANEFEIKYQHPAITDLNIGEGLVECYSCRPELPYAAFSLCVDILTRCSRTDLESLSFLVKSISQLSFVLIDSREFALYEGPYEECRLIIDTANALIRHGTLPIDVQSYLYLVLICAEIARYGWHMALEYSQTLVELVKSHPDRVYFIFNMIFYLYHWSFMVGSLSGVNVSLSRDLGLKKLAVFYSTLGTNLINEWDQQSCLKLRATILGITVPLTKTILSQILTDFRLKLKIVPRTESDERFDDLWKPDGWFYTEELRNYLPKEILSLRYDVPSYDHWNYGTFKPQSIVSLERAGEIKDFEEVEAIMSSYNSKSN